MSNEKDEEKSFADKIRLRVFGPPRDVRDPGIFHKIALIPFFAWVGLGADGLSSSAYGPEEAFRNLGSHTYMAVFLGLAMALTVFIIAYTYSKIIERFPHGGGGYIVATKTIGKRRASSRAAPSSSTTFSRSSSPSSRAPTPFSATSPSNGSRTRSG